MQRLLHGLIGGLDREAESCPDTGSCRWTEMRNMINLVLVQANARYEIDLNFVSGRDPTDQISPGTAAMLHRCENWRDVIRGVRIVGREKRVVKIQLPNRH